MMLRPDSPVVTSSKVVSGWITPDKRSMLEAHLGFELGVRRGDYEAFLGRGVLLDAGERSRPLPWVTEPKTHLCRVRHAPTQQQGRRGKQRRK